MAAETVSFEAVESYLPETVRALVKAMGLPAVETLVRTWGGIAIYIPRPDHLGPGHELVLALGQEAAVALCEHFVSGGHWTPPRCHQALLRVRNAEIQRKRREGRRPWQLAQEYRLTERRIWAILAEEDFVGEDREEDMFG
jgi:Mor family transcriptional regulator